jgi:hypothetical protein
MATNAVCALRQGWWRNLPGRKTGERKGTARLSASTPSQFGGVENVVWGQPVRGGIGRGLRPETLGSAYVQPGHPKAPFVPHHHEP